MSLECCSVLLWCGSAYLEWKEFRKEFIWDEKNMKNTFSEATVYSGKTSLSLFQ